MQHLATQSKKSQRKMTYHFKKKDVYLRDNKTIKPEFVGNTNKVRMRVVDQTTLDTLLLKDTIILSDYKIIEKLQIDYNRSGMVGVKASSYDTIKASGSLNNYDNGSLARIKVESCFKHIKEKLGIASYLILRKLVENKGLTNEDLLWVGDKKNVGKLSEKINDFYGMWNKN